jgi:hypothetical protein
LPWPFAGSLPQLDDDDEGIHRLRCGTPQMLDASLHIHNQRLIAAQQEMGDQVLEEHALRADSAGTATVS